MKQRNMYAPWNRKRFLANKPKKGTPGGEYCFRVLGKDFILAGRFILDMESPSDDHQRWVATAESARIIRRIVCDLADKQCQLKESPLCWKWAPVDKGQPHHAIHKKMGGAFTDDRIWLQIDGELVQIRLWACPNCHQKHHNRLYFKGSAA